jgi:Zn finger protein HypA/HybF involved in hydrogenase expression
MDKEKIYYCPHCGGAFHHITEKFSVDVPLRGDMFKKIPEFAELMWDTCFPEEEHITGDALVCPECGQTYGDVVTGMALPSLV